MFPPMFIQLTQWHRDSSIEALPHGRPIYIQVNCIIAMNEVSQRVIRSEADRTMKITDRKLETCCNITYAGGEDSVIQVQESIEVILERINISHDRALANFVEVVELSKSDG